MSIKEEQNMEELILEAATDLFLAKGFSSTSTTEIAKKAGCNQALVHYYFRTKDKLFDAIFQKKLKFFLSSLLSISKEELSFEQKLTLKIEAHYDAIASDPQLPLFLFSEISTNPSRLEALKVAVGNLPEIVLQQLQTELDEEVLQGKIRPTAVRDLLLTIVSLNVMVFLIEPMFKTIVNISSEEFRQLQAERKKKNVEIVLKSLKP